MSDSHTYLSTEYVHRRMCDMRAFFLHIAHLLPAVNVLKYRNREEGTLACAAYAPADNTVIDVFTKDHSPWGFTV